MDKELSTFNIKGLKLEISDEKAREKIENAEKWDYIDLTEPITRAINSLGGKNLEPFVYKIYFNKITKMYITTPLNIECITNEPVFGTVSIDLTKYSEKSLMNNMTLGTRLVEGSTYIEKIGINENIFNFNFAPGEGGYYMNFGGMCGLYE